MADYGALKVPDLKKLLQERNLATSGNKADLIKRLQEADKEAEASGTAAAPATTTAAEPEDEIDYEDDDVIAPAAPAAAEPAAPTDTAAAAPAAAATDAAPAEQSAATTTADKPVEADAATAAPTTEAGAAPAAPVFTANLPETDPDSEAAKRLARAKRFGISEDDLAAKKAARAARFGLEKEDIAKSLDAPLPERQRKRGRGGEDSADKEGLPAAKKAAGSANGHRGRDNRQQRNGQRGGQNKNQRPAGGKQGAGAAQPKPVIDPAEKAKMEARAKRFAS